MREKSSLDNYPLLVHIHRTQQRWMALEGKFKQIFQGILSTNNVFRT
jgi:hypothetical protein